MAFHMRDHASSLLFSREEPLFRPNSQGIGTDLSKSLNNTNQPYLRDIDLSELWKASEEWTADEEHGDACCSGTQISERAERCKCVILIAVIPTQKHSLKVKLRLGSICIQALYVGCLFV